VVGQNVGCELVNSEAASMISSEDIAESYDLDTDVDPPAKVRVLEQSKFSGYIVKVTLGTHIYCLLFISSVVVYIRS